MRVGLCTLPAVASLIGAAVAPTGTESVVFACFLRVPRLAFFDIDNTLINRQDALAGWLRDSRTSLGLGPVRRIM
ncbi:hypothetical protein FHS39_001384 [Streptomyces olivoverticillatus]|uniref:Uncharacterized protein n=1 Tax=Streptomyces olivoverticillatus TaxID=66427 RepID=A0A7W7LLB6_9ACTN|nr:hypothetical protein [Streptomyces olivoverticillatus]